MNLLSRMKPLLPWLLAAFFAFVAVPANVNAADITVEFLDVGQGNAVLIRSPEGKAALVDAGPSSNILNLLDARGVQNIDLAVATHHHADHIGGMAAVIRKYPPKVYLDNGSGYTTATYKHVLDAVKASGTTFVQPEDKERKIKLGTVLLRVFPLPPSNRNENNNSIGIRVQYGDFSVLLTGDSENHERAWWQTHVDKDLFSKVTVLMVAHHGSHNGIDSAWVKAASPKLAVISCSARNQYGHPHVATLDVLKQAEIPTKRTDTDGTIVIKSDGTEWHIVEGEKKENDQTTPTTPRKGRKTRRNPVRGEIPSLVSSTNF